MKKLRIAAWIVFALTSLGAYLILSMRYYDHFVLFSMLENYWALVLLLAAVLMLLLLTVLRIRDGRKNGKKRVLPVIAAVLLIVTAGLLAAAVCLPQRLPYHLTKTEYVSPDGQHMLLRRERTDLFGMSCYVYGMQGSGLRYYDLFDDDSVQIQEPEWTEQGFVYRGSMYDYPD